jgi:hypothetical protein
MVWLLRMARCAVVLTTSVLWGWSGVSADRVTLWADLPSEFSPLAVRQLERELQAIVKPAGLQLGWRRLPVEAGAVVDGASIVVRFRGACTPDSESRLRGPAAGWAHTSNGSILPFIDIDCGRVWSAVEADLEREAGFLREFHLGRALARVLAHELRHVLANTAGHGSSGLTKARLQSSDLIRGSYTLTAADLRRGVELTVSPATAPAAGDAALPSGVSGSRWGVSPSAAAHGPAERSLLRAEPAADR